MLEFLMVVGKLLLAVIFFGCWFNGIMSFVDDQKLPNNLRHQWPT